MGSMGTGKPGLISPAFQLIINLQKRRRINYPRPPERPQSQQIIIPGNQVVGVGFQRTLKDAVIISVPADTLHCYSRDDNVGPLQQAVYFTLCRQRAIAEFPLQSLAYFIENNSGKAHFYFMIRAQGKDFTLPAAKVQPGDKDIAVQNYSDFSARISARYSLTNRTTSSGVMPKARLLFSFSVRRFSRSRSCR